MASTSSDPQGPLVNQRSWRLRKFFSDLTNSTESQPTAICEIGNDKYALVYGGANPLGSRCIMDLKMKGWWVACADSSASLHADANILVFPQEDIPQFEKHITSSIKRILNGKKLDLIYCTPDAFQDGGVEDNLVSVGATMWQTHMMPSMICAKLASMFLAPNGVLVFTGNLLAMTPNTDMIAYSIVKTSVVHLTKCLAIPGSGMPSNSRVFCLLPRYLDTATARCQYKQIHRDSFTPLHVISDLVLSWTRKENLPLTGSVFQIVTDNNITDISKKSW